MLDDLFPVPLVHIDGVQIVQNVLVAPDGVHVGIQPLSGIEVIAIQRHALPLGQRLHDLRFTAGVQDVERDRALIAVEVVVQAGGLFHKQRRGHAKQIQIGRELILKQALEQTDGLLRLVNSQQAFVSFGNVGVHFDIPSSVSMRIRS